MSRLPPLRGTTAQVRWAETIRVNTLTEMLDAFPSGTAEYLEKIDDSTWWIGNRSRVTNDRIVVAFKEPAGHQVVGGAPKGSQTPDLPLKALKDVIKARCVAPEDFKAYEVAPTGTPPVRRDSGQHDAEKFAASVSQTPALAEIAILALLGRLYKGDARERLLLAAENKQEDILERLHEQHARDLDGIRRILQRPGS